MKPARLGGRLAAGILSAGAVLAGLFSSSHAAIQGTEGPTSTGSVVVNASLLSRVRISNLTDLTFSDADLGPLIGSANTSRKSENVCAWSNIPNRDYFITATGSGPASAFALHNVAGPDIPYSVSWAQTTDATIGTALTAGTKSTQFTSTSLTSNCLGNASATLLVTIAGADAETMVAGVTYTGTLTLLMTPS